MTTRQFVILAQDQSGGGELPPIGTRDELVKMLAPLNTAPDRPGGDILYGPGVTIQLPPDTGPVRQMLLSITEEEIAWHVISRIIKVLECKVLDPSTGMVLGEVPSEP